MNNSDRSRTSYLRRLLWMIQKDLALFLADRNGAILTLATPTVLAILLSVVFGPREKSNKLDILLIDEKPTAASQAFSAQLAAHDSLQVTTSTLVEATEKLKSGKAGLALVLPEDLASRTSLSHLLGGGGLSLELLHDPSRDIEASMAAGLITEAAFRAIGGQLLNPDSLQRELSSLRPTLSLAKAAGAAEGQWLDTVDTALRAFGDTQKEAGTADSAGQPFEMPLRVHLSPVVAAGPRALYNSFAHNFSGMLAMFLLFLALDRARHQVDERTHGTLVRLRLAPVPRWLGLLGFGASTAAIALLVAMTVFGVGFALFGIPLRGSALGFALVIGGNCIFSAGFALVLAGFARSASQIANIGVFAVLVASFAGGVWLPAFLLPDWLQSIGQALPTRWTMDGLAACTWRGLPLSAAIAPAVLLGGGGLALGALGIWRFRWSA